MPNHTFSTPLLSRRQFVTLALIGVFTRFEFQAYRGTDKMQGITKVIIEVSLISVRHSVRLVTMNHNHRRVLPALVSIA